MTILKRLSQVFLVAAISAGAAASYSTGCKQTGVGDPCVPEQEYNPDFNGFDFEEVNVESKSFQCQTRLCLVNHFQGRVSCPYGQDGKGVGPVTADGGTAPSCVIPGSPLPIIGKISTDPDAGLSVDGTPHDPTVPAQCGDRPDDRAVYCSCRCANLDNKTDDGSVYCKCPEGFSCSQLVTSIGQGDTGLTGAYCVKDGTDYKGRGDTCQLTRKP